MDHQPLVLSPYDAEMSGHWHVDEFWLGRVEANDNLFPEVDYRYWV